jgi:cell division protease FtsH
MAEREFFLGQQVGPRNLHSEATAILIDEEIRGIVETGEAHAREILSQRFGQLALVAKNLLDRETLSGDQIRALLDGGSPEPDLPARCYSP